MSRPSYILFLLMTTGFLVSIYLYNQSKENSRKFNDRVNTVSRVLVLLEKTDSKRELLRLNVYEDTLTDNSLVFGTDDKREVDSILTILQSIVLYDEQRLRIDTMKTLFTANFDNLLRKDGPLKYRQITEVISRAKSFAAMRLQQQQDAFTRHEANMSMWVTFILITSFALFVIGVASTIAENVAKKRLKNLHESILGSASIGIAVYEVRKSNDGTCDISLSFSNDGASAMRNSDRDTVLIDLSEFVFENASFRSTVERVFVDGRTIVDELRRIHEGIPYFLLTNLSRVSPTKVAFYYQDITRRKEFENELKNKLTELESVNEELERFAHATSHDLREPFRKIQVMADLIKQKHNPANQEKYIETILKAADKGSKLVEQILNYSKIQFDNSRQEPVDINAILEQLREDFDLLILEKNAQINAEKLPVVFGNAVQISQLFSNLIGNSLKFVSKERKPVIDIFYEEVSDPDMTGLDGAPRFHMITIKDNGIGFPEEYSSKIFNAFERLNMYDDFPGFGLGLSLCKKIVTNHGGTIKAYSAEGKGSSFAIYLPVTTSVSSPFDSTQKSLVEKQ